VAAEIGSDSLSNTLRRIERSVLRRDDPNYRLGELSTQMAIAAAVDDVRELPLLDRWTYAMCPVDDRDEGIERLAEWAAEHAVGRTVAPPLAGRLPPPDRADQEALQFAERVHRRLVAWRWMALRFPDTYRDLTVALSESRRLNEWIETVLSIRPSGRSRLGLGTGPVRKRVALDGSGAKVATRGARRAKPKRVDRHL
jgi:ATP-dependent RNA helicase SUPV3L1/SUV3